MNEMVANMIKEKVMAIRFADKVGGLVRPVTINMNGEKKTFPVSWDVSSSDLQKGKYKDLMPCSKYKSLMYFEDGGTTMLERINDIQFFQSNLRLIGWIDTSKFPQFKCTNPLAPQMIIEIMEALPTAKKTEAPFLYMEIKVNSESVKSASIFGAYTYDEQSTQYLFYPYDYFLLNISVRYGINYNCEY